MRVNYKSDFDFIMKVRSCNNMGNWGFPNFDWTAKFYTTNKLNTYNVSCIGGQCVNCFNDNGEIHVVMNNPNIGVGVLNVEMTVMLPNDIYPDGEQSVTSTQQMDIVLVNGIGDCGTKAEVEMVLPAIKGEKGDTGDKGEKGEKGDNGTPFTYDDFTPEQLDDLKRPAIEAAKAAYDSALKAQEATGQSVEATQQAAEATKLATSATLKLESLQTSVEAATQSANEAAAKAGNAADNLTENLALKQDKLTTSDDLNLTGNRLSLNDIAKKRLFIDQWNITCGIFGKYNEATGFFELNGLNDITYEQALKIYAVTAHRTDHAYYGSQVRTNIPLSMGMGSIPNLNFILYHNEFEVYNAQINTLYFLNYMKIQRVTAILLYSLAKLRKCLAY